MPSSAVKVYVGPCRLGRGVFARRPIAAGEQIFRFTGKVITKAEALRKGERAGDPLQIGVDQYLDLEAPAVYTNHSCLPNAGIRDDVVLVALRAIAGDEEIVWDYSTTIGQEDGWVMECRCGMPTCRRLISSFHELPLATQQHYLELGIVQTFLREEFQRNGHVSAPAGPIEGSRRQVRRGSDHPDTAC